MCLALLSSKKLSIKAVDLALSTACGAESAALSVCSCLGANVGDTAEEAGHFACHQVLTLYIYGKCQIHWFDFFS